MKVKDRIISFLLTVVMVVGLLPLGQVANAAGNYSASFYAYNYSTSNYTAHDTIYIRNALGNAKVGYDSASFDTRIYMYNDGDKSWEYNPSCFNIPSSCEWLHSGWASPEELQSGSVEPGRSMKGVCTLIPKPGLPAGTYSTTITFNDVGGNFSKTVDVIFSVEPDPDFNYTVQVTNGTANGRNGYVWQPINEARAGTEIQLVADSYATQVFDNWTYNQPVTHTQGSSDTNCTTYITMPTGNLEATANYVDVYSSQPSSGTATIDSDYTVTWSLNKTPTSGDYRLYSVNGGGVRTWKGWVNATSATISGSGKTDGLVETYCVSIEYDDVEYFSENFTITWDASIPAPINTYSISVNYGVAEYQDEPNSYGIRPWITASTVAVGTEIRLSAGTAPAGKEFDKWVVDSGTITLADATSATTTFTMPAEDVEVTATYKDISVTTYNVAFESNGGSVVAAQTVADGSKAVKPSDPTKNGFTFDGWYQDSTLSVVFDFNTAITGNITLYAKWLENSVVPTNYTVTFESNGGSAVASQTVANGSKATKPSDPTRDGFTFGGWYQDATLSVAFDFDTTITTNVKVYAKWTENASGTVYYTVVSGGNGSFDIGSASDIVVTVKRSVADETCFAHFGGVEIDGVALVKGTDYTAVVGSTVVTIKAATLNKLSAGEHAIKVIFDDGTVVTSITLKNASAATPSPTPTVGAVPKTGEDTSMMTGLGILCLAVSGVVFSVVLFERKKRKSAQ